MDANNNTEMTPCLFWDGKKYMVSVNVNQDPKSLSIVISKEEDVVQKWSCLYDVTTLEDFTRQNGNFKYFDVFVTMIKSALVKSTNSVTLDLMSSTDLKAIRSENETSHCPKGVTGMGEVETDSKIKYLVVTYTSEFDKVYYPITLNYSGQQEPDSIAMQNDIQKLKAEVAHLRCINSELSTELKRITEQEHKEQENLKDTESTDGNNNKVAVQHLMNTVQYLEENSVKYLRRIKKLVAANKILREKLEAIKRDKKVKARVVEPERPLTSVRLVRPPYSEASGLNSQGLSTMRSCRYRSASPIGIGAGVGGVKTPGRFQQSQTNGPEVIGDGTSKRQLQPFALRSKSCSSSPRIASDDPHKSKKPRTVIIVQSKSNTPTFNPTAYILAKKERDEKIRLEKQAEVQATFRGERREQKMSTPTVADIIEKSVICHRSYLETLAQKLENSELSLNSWLRPLCRQKDQSTSTAALAKGRNKRIVSKSIGAKSDQKCSGKSVKTTQNKSSIGLSGSLNGGEYLIQPKVDMNVTTTLEETNDEQKRNQIFMRKVDVKEYEVGEIAIKAIKGLIKVEGRHKSETSTSNPSFSSEIAIPIGVKADDIKCVISTDGILTISAPIEPIQKGQPIHKEILQPTTETRVIEESQSSEEDESDKEHVQETGVELKVMSLQELSDLRSE